MLLELVTSDDNLVKLMTRTLFQIVVVGTYLIASAFFNVYSMGVDTIFLCFCEFLVNFHS